MAKDNYLGAILVIGLGIGLVSAGLSRQTTTAPRSQPIDQVPISTQVGGGVFANAGQPGYPILAAGLPAQPVDYVASALERTRLYTADQIAAANAVAGLYGYTI